jgi:hypothetical protein
MDTISISHFLGTLISAIPVRERAFLLLALGLSLIVWLFYRQLRFLAAAPLRGYQIAGSAAAGEPRLDDARMAFSPGQKFARASFDISAGLRKARDFNSLTEQIRMGSTRRELPTSYRRARYAPS